MTKQEAIAEMRAGRKVTHKYFSPHEYMYMIDEVVYSEEGVKHGSVDDFFVLRTATHFNQDWEIFDSPEIQLPPILRTSDGVVIDDYFGDVYGFINGDKIVWKIPVSTYLQLHKIGQLNVFSTEDAAKKYRDQGRVKLLVYERDYDNPNNADGSPKANPLLGEFEIIQTLFDGGYDSLKVGVKDNKVFLIEGREITGMNGGTHYVITELTSVVVKL